MTERLEGLYSSYGHQCGCGGDSPSTGTQIARLAKSGDKDKHTPPEPRPSVSKKAYRWVYKAGGMTPEMLSDRPIRKMIEETSSSLSTALDEDIAQELTPEMRNALERDVFLFSGFKTYHNLKEASLLLENKERGGIQTFDEFYRSIRAIDDKYNRDWLRSEYQFAVNSAAMASQWEQALKDKDLYALQYVTVGDDRVRPEHAELDGLVLPMDDPFWRTGTPPNGWGCRCTVMQVPLEEHPLTPQEQSDRSRAASAALNDMTEGKNSIFRFNPYYDQALFPPTHPYFGKKGYRHCSSDRFTHADGDADPCNIYRILNETAEEKQALLDARKAAKENLLKCKEGIPINGSFPILKGNSVLSGTLLVTRGSLKAIKDHSYGEVKVQKWLAGLTLQTPLKVRYIGWSEVRWIRDKDGNLVSTHPEAELFTYYEMELEGQTFYINAKAHRDFELKEVFYTLEPNPPKNLIQGIPDIYKK